MYGTENNRTETLQPWIKLATLEPWSRTLHADTEHEDQFLPGQGLNPGPWQPGLLDFLSLPYMSPRYIRSERYIEKLSERSANEMLMMTFEIYQPYLIMDLLPYLVHTLPPPVHCI
jgi:hypothetical protein